MRRSRPPKICDSYLVFVLVRLDGSVQTIVVVVVVYSTSREEFGRLPLNIDIDIDMAERELPMGEREGTLIICIASHRRLKLA